MAVQGAGRALDRFGKKDPFGDGDYWLVDDNWGRRAQQVEIQNLNFLQPEIIKALQTMTLPISKK